MLDYVYNYDELVARFVAMLIPHCRRGFGRCKTVGVIDDAGQLIAGLVYHNYDPEAGSHSILLFPHNFPDPAANTVPDNRAAHFAGSDDSNPHLLRRDRRSGGRQGEQIAAQHFPFTPNLSKLRGTG